MNRSPTRTSPSAARRAVLRGLLALTALGAACLLAEVALRALMTEAEVNGNYWGMGAFEAFGPTGYRHAPGFRGHAVRPGVFDIPVAIGEHGLRQGDLAAQAAYPERLLVLGDSFAFGLGVAEEAAFPRLLAGSLNPAGVGVINGAQTGFATRQEVAFGLWLAEIYTPRTVLLCLYLDNDVDGDFYADHERVEVRHGYRFSTERWLRGGAFDLLRGRSYLWKLADGRLNQLRSRWRRREFLHLARAETGRVLQPTLAALDDLGRHCAERGIRLAVVLIPPLKGRTLFDQPVAAHLEGRGVPVLDLTGAFGQADYFDGDGHWNEGGHARAAELLAAFLARLGAGGPAP